MNRNHQEHLSFQIPTQTAKLYDFLNFANVISKADEGGKVSRSEVIRMIQMVVGGLDLHPELRQEISDFYSNLVSNLTSIRMPSDLVDRLCQLAEELEGENVKYEEEEVDRFERFLTFSRILIRETIEKGNSPKAALPFMIRVAPFSRRVRRYLQGVLDRNLNEFQFPTAFIDELEETLEEERVEALRRRSENPNARNRNSFLPRVSDAPGAPEQSSAATEGSDDESQSPFTEIDEGLQRELSRVDLGGDGEVGASPEKTQVLLPARHTGTQVVRVSNLPRRSGAGIVVSEEASSLFARYIQPHIDSSMAKTVQDVTEIEQDPGIDPSILPSPELTGLHLNPFDPLGQGWDDEEDDPTVETGGPRGNLPEDLKATSPDYFAQIDALDNLLKTKK